MATEFSLNALRFEDIRAGVIRYLEENSSFNAEFDFSASNLGYLVDINAYTAMMLAYHNVLRANNIFIDTTEIRKNAVSIAKQMGYRPKRKISSRFSGKLEYVASEGQTFQSGDTITVPARTEFISSPNGYSFLNLIPITLTFKNSALLSSDFIIYEGEFVVVNAYGTGQINQTYVIDSYDVEENNINVSIRDSNTDRYHNVLWSETDSFFSTSDERIYFVEEDLLYEYRPRIVFGDGILGRIPSNSETIEIEYLKTKGNIANGETGLSFAGDASATTTGSTFDTYSYNSSNLSIYIPDLQLSYGGKAAQTLAEIQFNAPRFYSAGNRGVTGDDLITILSEYESTFQYYNVVGGNVLYPADPTKRGIGYITAVPFIDESDFLGNASIYLTELQENAIIPQLISKTVLGTDRRFMKPTYIYIDANPFIEFPANYSADEIQAGIVRSANNLQTYVDDYIKGLGKPFRHSKLLTTLTDTLGVKSAKLDTTFHFIINDGSFYEGRETTMTLPIVYSKDSAGQIIYDDNSNPETSNFIKKRSLIISQENEKRLESNAYTQVTLPVSKSPVYGQLSHLNSTRYLYNIDVSKVQFITFEMVGSSGNEVLSYDLFEFTDESKIEYRPNLYEIGLITKVQTDDTMRWLIQFNSRNVAFLDKDMTTEVFSVVVTDETYLNSIGIILDESRSYVNWEAVTPVTTWSQDTSVVTTQYLTVTGSESTDYILRCTTAGITSSTEPIWATEITAIGDAVTDGTSVWTAIQLSVPWYYNNVYSLNDLIVEEGADSTNYIIKCSKAGTSGRIQPEWATDITVSGDTVTQDGVELINLDYIEETDENDDSSAYYSITFSLNNELITDVRIYGNTELCTAQYEPSTNRWTYSGLKTFQVVDSLQDSGYREIPLEAYDENDEYESFVDLVDTYSTNTVFSMANFNGDFSLNNNVLGNFTQFGLRNDLSITANYTIEQESNEVEYSYSSLSDPTDNVQTIVLKAKESSTVDVGGNGGHVLHEKHFFTYTALNNVLYAVWYNDEDVVAIEEQSTLTCSPVGTSIVAGDYFTYNTLDSASGTETERYVYYEVDGSTGNDPSPGGIGAVANVYSDTAEKTSITFPAVAGNITAADYFYFYTYDSDFGTENKQFVWFQVNDAGTKPTPPDTDPADGYEADVYTGVREKSTITMLGESAITLGDYFSFYTLDSTNGNETLRYVYFEKNGSSGNDPSLAGGVPYKADITTSDDASAVAAVVIAAIEDIIDISLVGSSGADVVIRNDYNGAVTAGLTSGGISSPTIVRNTTGVSDTAENVAAAVLAALAGASDISTTGSTGATVVIENDYKGVVTAATATGTGLTWASYVRDAIGCEDTAANVATQTLAALSGVGDIDTSSSSGSDVVILNDYTGRVTNPLTIGSGLLAMSVVRDVIGLGDGEYQGPSTIGGQTVFEIEVGIANGDSAEQVRDATVAAIGAEGLGFTDLDAVAVSDDTSAFTLSTILNGATYQTYDGESPNNTGFTFTRDVVGVDNTTDEIYLLQAGDVVYVDGFITSDDPNDLGNQGYFVIESVDSINGLLYIYNGHGESIIDGVGVITHYKVTSGTYGNYTVYGSDIYHDSSIGYLNYESGEVVYRRTVKGYSDYAAGNTYIRTISQVFDNYGTQTSFMDKIRLIPIDSYSNTGVFLGQLNDFDSIFSQCLQVNITTPIVMK